MTEGGLRENRSCNIFSRSNILPSLGTKGRVFCAKCTPPLCHFLGWLRNTLGNFCTRSELQLRELDVLSVLQAIATRDFSLMSAKKDWMCF